MFRTTFIVDSAESGPLYVVSRKSSNINYKTLIINIEKLGIVQPFPLSLVQLYT